MRKANPFSGQILAFCVTLALFFSAHAETAKIKLLNFNAGLLSVFPAGDFVKGVDARGQALPGEMSKFVKQKSPDVILLTEVWEKGHQDNVTAALKKLGYEVEVPVGKFKETDLLSKFTVGYKGSSGLLVAWNKATVEMKSKFHIETYADHSLVAYYETGTAKVAVSGHMRLKASGSPFLFVGAYSTALDVDPNTGLALDNEEDKELKRVNAGQMQLVVDIANQEVLPNEMLVVMGDFNVGPTLEKENFEILTQGLGAASLLPDGPTWDRKNFLVQSGRYPNDPSSVIDHIFVRDSSAADFTVENIERAFMNKVDYFVAPGAKAQKIPLSDHYGVYVEGSVQGR